METLGTLIIWLVVGSVAGGVTHLVAEKTGSGSAEEMMDDSVIGMVGAFLCGFAQSLLLPDTFALTGFNLSSVLLIFFATVLLLFMFKQAMNYCRRMLV